MQNTFKELEEKQQIIEKELKFLEKQIYDLETIYFDETCYSGNIVKGWDQYLLSKSNKGQIPLNQKKPKISVSERIFSMSSFTSPVQQQNQQEDQNGSNKYQLIVDTNSNNIQRSKRNQKKKNYQNIANMNEQNIFESQEYVDSQGQIIYQIIKEESENQDISQVETPLKIKKNLIKKNKKLLKKNKNSKI